MNNNFKNTTMSKTSVTLTKAHDIFQKLSLETQKYIKSEEPEMYHALFGGDALVNNYVLDQFFDKYEPLNEKIKTFDDLNNLSLEKQVFFKENFPGEYNEIMGIV